MNFNDARISALYVTPTNVDVQDASPNAPGGAGAPATSFDLHLEMEAGGGVASPYQLKVIAYDVSAATNNSAMDPPPGPLNGPANFAVAPWAVAGAGPDRVFEQKANIIVPAGVIGHVFYYTAALVSNNGQQVDIKQSDHFILV